MLTRRTRILLLIVAALCYFCSQAFCTEVPGYEVQYISSNESLDYDVHDRNIDRENTTFSTNEEALLLIRQHRTTQLSVPTKVVKDRKFSEMARPWALENKYNQRVTAYLQFSYIISLSLPPEEIAFPFTVFW